MGLNRFSVLLVGAGSLGTAILKLLCELEPKTVGIVDGDIVERKNLKNQQIYTVKDVVNITNKADACVKELSSKHKKTKLTSYPFYITDKNAARLVTNYDVIIDATDSIQSRAIVNYACILGARPLLMVSAKDDNGLAYIITGDSACFNCIKRNSNLTDNSCYSISIKLSNAIAALAVDELLAYIEKRNGKAQILEFSLKSNRVSRYYVKKDAACEVCNSRAPYKQTTNDMFIHACGNALKFSFKRELDTAKLKVIFGHKSAVRNGYLILREGNKSLFISSFGDVLMTGYDERSAQAILSRISSAT